MAVITSTSFTERMSRRLKSAGINLWVAQSSGDRLGKYLLFRVGGSCVAGCGWTQAEAEQRVYELVINQRTIDDPIEQRRIIAESL